MDLKGTDTIPESDAALVHEIGLNLRASPKAVDRLLDSQLLAAGIPGLASQQSFDAPRRTGTRLLRRL